MTRQMDEGQKATDSSMQGKGGQASGLGLHSKGQRQRSGLFNGDREMDGWMGARTTHARGGRMSGRGRTVGDRGRRKNCRIRSNECSTTQGEKQRRRDSCGSYRARELAKSSLHFSARGLSFLSGQRLHGCNLFFDI